MEKSFASFLKPFEEKLKQLTSTQKEPSSVGLQELKQQQLKLVIESQAKSLSSSGAQSQFRSVANLKLKISNAIEALDDFIITSTSPDDEVYSALTPIKATLTEAVSDAEERINLILKADADPRYGWKAITAFEEKQKLDTKDPEKEKVFAACLKKVQEAEKKSKISSSRPFRSTPGGQPGYTQQGVSSY